MFRCTNYKRVSIHGEDDVEEHSIIVACVGFDTWMVLAASIISSSMEVPVDRDVVIGGGVDRSVSASSGDAS